MKLKLLLALMLGCAMGAFAQGGYQDGVDYFNASRYTEAKRILTKTINDPATDKAVSFYYLGCIDLASTEDHQPDFAAAKANFEKGIQANPNNAYNYIGLAEVAFKQGDKAGAAEQIKTAEKLGKKDAAVMAGIARCYYNVDPVTYAKEIRKYIEKGYKESKYQEPAVYMLEGDMSAATDPGAASGFYDTAIRLAKEAGGRVNPEAYIKCANALFKSNKQEAFSYLQRLNEDLPTSALAQRELAEMYYKDDQWSRAAVQYGKYMSNPNHFPEDEARYSFLLFYGQKYEESLAIAQKLVKENPDNFYMVRMELYDLVALKRWEDAANTGKQLFAMKNAEFMPKDFEDYGTALDELKEYDAAIALYEKGVAMFPDRASLWDGLSEQYTNAEKYAEAAMAQDKYCSLKGDKCTANDYYVLARRYFNLALSREEGSAGRSQASATGVQAIDKAIDIVPDNGLLWRLKAQLLQAGDPTVTPEVASCYEKMIDCFSKETSGRDRSAALSSAYAILGNYYVRQGDKATARSYFEKYLQINPDDNDVRNYLKNL